MDPDLDSKQCYERVLQSKVLYPDIFSVRPQGGYIHIMTSKAMLKFNVVFLYLLQLIIEINN